MISATSVVVNIFINAVLIYGLFGMPRMEIAGAALATVTARIIEVTWCIMVPLGLIAAFVLKLPVLAVYFIISLDEFVKIPAVYLNYKKYRWVKDLTVS